MTRCPTVAAVRASRTEVPGELAMRQPLPIVGASRMVLDVPPAQVGWSA